MSDNRDFTQGNIFKKLISFILSIQPNTNLTLIGISVPLSSLFGIIINTVYFIIFRRKTRKSEIEIV